MKKKENIFKKKLRSLWMEEEHHSFSDSDIDELIAKKREADAAYPYAPPAPGKDFEMPFESSSSSGGYDFGAEKEPDFVGAYNSYHFGSAESEPAKDSFEFSEPYDFSPYEFSSAEPEPEQSSVIALADSSISDYGGGIFDPDGLYIDWSDDAVAVCRLNIKNFGHFAKARFEEMFLTAYAGARSKEKALSITCNALARMLSYEAFAPDADNTPLSYAIESSLYVFMTKGQRASAQEHPISMENVRNKPTTIEKDACIQKAFEKAKRDIPRYAPVFSGTTGATVVLLIVAVIIAATAFIWMKPFGHSDKLLSDSDASEFAQITVDPLAAINPHFLVDMEAAAQYTDKNGEEYTTSALPILLYMSGPDVVSLSDISALMPNGAEGEVYQYSSAGYCFFTEGSGNYRITATDRAGEQAVGYIRVPSSFAANENAINTLFGYYAVAHDRETEFKLFDKAALEELGYNAQIIKYPASSVMSMSGDMTSASFASQGITGLESFTVRLSSKNTADSFDIVVPLMIYNNAPVVDISSLNSFLLHTPNENGIFAGHLSAADPDGDSIRFELTQTKNCSVMLAPDGGFIMIVDEGCREESAWFGFTVSDGLLTTIEYRRTFNLSNRLLDRSEYSQELICYCGNNGWYELSLPKTDLDGDELRWRVISPLENGLTALGNSVMVSADGRTVSFRINPEKNEAFEETLELVCSDGWSSSDPISFTCRIKENAAPIGSSANNAIISSGETVVCRLILLHDCIFDKDSDCAIVDVTRVKGGEVIGNEGWSELSFRFKHDGESRQCYVDAVVQDNLTGKKETVRFYITVQ